MIKNLNGITETVVYQENSSLRLYHNQENENYPPHWHAGIEIIMPLENYYDVYIDKQLHHVEAGEIIFINSGEIHSLHAPETGSRIIMQVDLSLMHNVKDFNTSLYILPSALILSHDAFPDIYPVISKLMRQIVKEYDGEGVLTEAIIYGYLIQIYVLLCRNILFTQNSKQYDKPGQQQAYIEKMMLTCDYINSNSNEPLTLEQAAAATGFSKFHYSRLFKHFTGLTFYKYLNQCRLKKAEVLLMNPNLTITDVAMMTGFNNMCTFNRVFKSHNGFTPKDFRKHRVSPCEHRFVHQSQPEKSFYTLRSGTATHAMVQDIRTSL